MPGFLGNIDTFEKRYKVREFDEDTNNSILGSMHICLNFVRSCSIKNLAFFIPSPANILFISLFTLSNSAT